MKRIAPRRGMTLVELLIVALLGALVASVAWNMFLSGSKQSARLDTKLRHAQAALLLVERLSVDMAEAVVVPGDGEEGNRANGPDLTLYRFRDYNLDPGAVDRDPATAGAVRTERVVYRFDKRTGVVTRNGAPAALEPFADIRFQPPGATVPGVEVTVTTRPSAPAGGSALPARTFTFLLPLERRSLETAFPSWQENWFDLVPVVESDR